jgi:halimadienyl-diphosphate synthase
MLARILAPPPKKVAPVALPSTTDVGPVAYDSAVVARLRDAHGQLCFPQTLDWLVRHQHADGTWGGDRWHAHDRLVSTLAAIRTLHETNTAPDAVERALETIPELIARLDEDDHETIGFEVIVPFLIDWCAQEGLPVPQGGLTTERQRRAERIKQGTKGTLLFSLDGVDTIPPEVGRLVSPRGSLFASPSSTAAYLDRYPAAPRSWAYLVALAEQNNGGIPAVHPIEAFAASWSCFYLDLAGQGQSRLGRRLRARAMRRWQADGASYSSEAPLPNADETAVHFLIQRNAGLSPSLQVFEPFMTDRGARCYIHEYDMSASANVHVLMALRAAPAGGQRDKWISDILRYLHSVADSRSDGLLVDKWHIGPTYTTSRGILATYGLDDELCSQLRDALLRDQRPDGSWGSAEETAYALHALCFTDPKRYRVEIKAARASLQQLRHKPWPALWIGKSLYLPRPVVEYAIVAAEIMTANTLV